MLAGLQRHVEARRLGQVARPHPGGEHHGFGPDEASLGLDADDDTVGCPEFGDGHALDDRRAALLGTFRQGHRGVDR